MIRPEAVAVTTRHTMRWTVEFDMRQPLQTVVSSGEGCEILDAPPGREVVVQLPHAHHLLVSMRTAGARIHAGTSLFPVYCRLRGHQIVLSNRAADLFNDHEDVRLSAFVLLQQLLGANYPQYNAFSDIMLLEAHGVYEAAGDGLRYLKTTLTEGDRTDAAEALGILYNQFASVCESGRPLAVLLSGGYDSRFNLAIALHQAQRSGNRVHTFHEFKNEEEYRIAKAVADRVNVPLHCETRQRFAESAESTVFDPQFIAFHSCTYRDNIPRWHGYLRWIRTTLPDSIIIGHGAEGHKGKYYRQVLQIRRDAEPTFGADPARIAAAASALGIRDFDDDSQRRYFSQLCDRAEQFNDRFAQVDFLHYHTYVVNGYAHRTYDFQQFFGIPFPFADHRFLATVFSLPPEMKQDFELVKSGMAALAPELLNIPFTSGNAKALKPRSAAREFVRGRLQGIRGMKHRIDTRSPRRPLAPGTLERAQQVVGVPKSEITRRLLELLRKPDAGAGISPTFALQALLHFRLLEDKQRLSFTCT